MMTVQKSFSFYAVFMMLSACLSPELRRAFLFSSKPAPSSPQLHLTLLYGDAKNDMDFSGKIKIFHSHFCILVLLLPEYTDLVSVILMIGYFEMDFPKIFNRYA